MALVGNMIAGSSGPSIINYDLFTTVFGMLTLLYLIPATFNEGWSIHPLLMLVLDILNTLFFFCAAVATAAYLRVHSCSNRGYLNSNIVTRGSSSRCREAQASTAFLWFAWAAFMVSTVLTGLQSRGGANLRSSGPRRGPAMSQV